MISRIRDLLISTEIVLNSTIQQFRNRQLNMNSSINFLDKSCFVIAGPCSAESREQVLETAKQIAASGKVQAYRAGVWKPRTRPGGFEGMGAQALPWLQEVQTTYHLPVAIEVAQPEQQLEQEKENV